MKWTTRLQKWFEIDTSTKIYLDDTSQFYFVAKYTGKSGSEDDSTSPDDTGKEGRTYLVKDLSGSGAEAKLLAPNPPFTTTENG